MRVGLKCKIGLWNIRQIASRRFEKGKISPCDRGGDTPPSVDLTPPDFLKTGRARGQNFIAFLDSLGLYDHFEPNIAKYVRAVFE